MDSVNDQVKDAVDAALRGTADRIARDSKALTSPGGFCVPKLYDTGSLVRSIRLNPQLQAWLDEREALEAARPRRVKVARWLRRRRREASWRTRTAWRILTHGDDGSEDY